MEDLTNIVSALIGVLVILLYIIDMRHLDMKKKVQSLIKKLHRPKNIHL